VHNTTSGESSRGPVNGKQAVDTKVYPPLPPVPAVNLSRQSMGTIPPYSGAAQRPAASMALLAPVRGRHPFLLELDEALATTFPSNYKRIMPSSWGYNWPEGFVYPKKMGLGGGSYPGCCQAIYGARIGCKKGDKCPLLHQWFQKEDLDCFLSNPDKAKVAISKKWLLEAVHNVAANERKGNINPDHPLPIPPKSGQLAKYAPARATNGGDISASGFGVPPRQYNATTRGDKTNS
jgi:hypothetical protein